MFHQMLVRAGVSTFVGAADVVKKVRVITDVLASRKKGESRVAMNLTVFVTEEEFEKIVQHPDIIGGYEKAQMLKAQGLLPTCPRCGAVCTHGGSDAA